MDFIKKFCQCCCFGQVACQTSALVNCWWGLEAQGLSSLFCSACCWTLCAPLCIDCKLGEVAPATQNLKKGIKYCLFSCALCCVGPCDGCYNCFKVAGLACGEGVRRYADITANVAYLGNQVKTGLALETGNEPLKSMGLFQP